MEGGEFQRDTGGNEFTPSFVRTLLGKFQEIFEQFGKLFGR